MNPLNYCTLPYAQKLQAAGIVMDTQKNWVKCKDGIWVFMFIGDVGRHAIGEVETWISAPSMYEAWMELPGKLSTQWAEYYLLIGKDEEETVVEYRDTHWNLLGGSRHSNVNPTDALIDLRVWLEGRKEKL